MPPTRSPAPFAMRMAAWGWAPFPRAGAACAPGACSESTMIGRIAGTLVDKHPPQVVVSCHGVGYELDVPMSTFYNLPRTGEPVELLPHFVVREDAQLLFGFLTAAERTAFRRLLKVNGVGPKVALSVLSGLSVDDLAAAVAAQDAARLVKVPGIGRKTAERIVLEMRDKLTGIASASA